MPPMTSTTTSMSPRLTSAVASVVTRSGSMPSRTRDGRRTATPASSTGAPILAARSSACVVMMRATSEPTTPQPSSATFSGRVCIIRPRFLIPATVGPVSLTGRDFLSHVRIVRHRFHLYGGGRQEIFHLPPLSCSGSLLRSLRRLSRRRGSADVEAQQVLLRLAADDDAGLAVAHGDDRRPQDVVVVARHGAAVRARCGHRDEVTR